MKNGFHKLKISRGNVVGDGGDKSGVSGGTHTHYYI